MKKSTTFSRLRHEGMRRATSFTGNFLSGWLGSFWSGMAKPDFFVMIAMVAAVAGLAIWAFNRPLKHALPE